MNSYNLKIPKGIYIGSFIFSLMGLFVTTMGEEVVLGIVTFLFFGGAGGFTFYLQTSKKPILVIDDKKVKYGMWNTVTLPIERIYEIVVKGTGRDKHLQVQYSKNEKITILKIMNNLHVQLEVVEKVIQEYREQSTVEFDFTTANNYEKTANNSNYQNEVKSNWLMSFLYMFIFFVLYLPQSVEGFIPISFIIIGVFLFIDLVLAVSYMKEKINFKLRLRLFFGMYSLSMLYLIYIILSVFDIV